MMPKKDWLSKRLTGGRSGLNKVGFKKNNPSLKRRVINNCGGDEGDRTLDLSVANGIIGYNNKYFQMFIMTNFDQYLLLVNIW